PISAPEGLPVAMLIGTRGPLKGHQLSLKRECTVLGRQNDAAVVLESATVSRHHARIVYRDDSYLVEDLKSANGTFVNDRPVREAVRLTDGDTLRLGPYAFSFRMAAPPTASETDLIIRGEVSANPSETALQGQD